MARMASKVNVEFDAASAITLRDATDASETATSNEVAIALNLLTTAEWDNDEQPNGYLMVNIHITTIDRTTADETYTIAVMVDTADSFGSAVEVARLTGLTATGFYKIVVPRETIEKLEPGATHMRLTNTLAGTTPILDYHAWATYLT
jgi:hypothetical protein